MTVLEKIAYLKGLSEGLGVDESTKEGRVIKAIIETLGELANDVEDLGADFDDLSEQVDAIDEDLDALEEYVYEDEDDDEDDEDDEDEDDDDLYEIECPACKNSIFVNDLILQDGHMDCPNCGERLEFDFECDCGCCGDDCGCGEQGCDCGKEKE